MATKTTTIPTDRLCNRVRYNPIRASIHFDHTHVNRIIAIEDGHDLGLDLRESYPTYAAAWRSLMLAAIEHRIPRMILDGETVDVLESSRGDSGLKKSYVFGDFEPIYAVVYGSSPGRYSSPYASRDGVQHPTDHLFFASVDDAKKWAAKNTLMTGFVGSRPLVVAAYPHDIDPEHVHWQDELIAVVEEL